MSFVENSFETLDVLGTERFSDIMNRSAQESMIKLVSLAQNDNLQGFISMYNSLCGFEQFEIRCYRFDRLWSEISLDFLLKIRSMGFEIKSNLKYILIHKLYILCKTQIDQNVPLDNWKGKLDLLEKLDWIKVRNLLEKEIIPSDRDNALLVDYLCQKDDVYQLIIRDSRYSECSSMEFDS